MVMEAYGRYEGKFNLLGGGFLVLAFNTVAITVLN